MSRKISLFLSTLCTLALASNLLARNVFVLPPGDGVLRPIATFAGDPFAPGTGAGISAAADSFLAFATPAGNKFYFVSRSATDTVVITDANFGIIARRSLGTGATAAALSPDGRYLVVIAGAAQIIDTATDQVFNPIDVGSFPSDVAISRDSTRAFAAASGRLTAINLTNRTVVGTLESLGPINGVATGPNGLVYVAATNRLYEIDPRDLSLVGGAGIPLNAQPGKPSFAADQFGNVRAVMVNLNPSFGNSVLLSVDLATRVVTPLLFSGSGIVLDRVVAVSGSRAFATSTSQQLYEINLPNSIGAASFTGLTTTSGVRSIVASNEGPGARYLYIAFTNNTLARIDLTTNTLSGTFPLSNPPGALAYSGAAATGTPAQIITYNNNQFVNPSAQSLPLTIRAFDASGRPLSGVPIQFTTTASGASFVSTSSTTDSEGFAQAIVLVPPTLGPFTVTANAGTGVVVSANFNVNVGTGTVGPTGGISVRSGNGQVVRESGVTPELLRVVVRDAGGNPVPNAVVNWSVASNTNGAAGNLGSTQSVTDINGEATNTYIAPLIGPFLFQAYLQSVITASTTSSSVNMYVTVIPQLFGVNPASFPAVQILAPTTTDTITAQAGTTLPGAIQVRVIAGSGPGSGTPIPNVAVIASTGLDPTLQPTASCKGDTGLTDSTGVGSCDLVIGSKIGNAPLSIRVGGASASTLNLVVTPGLPGKLTILQGDNQSGAPGSTLPLALVARIEDSFGNALPNTSVTWTVESGNATLFNSITRGDTESRVSTLVRLGNTSGPVRIRLTATGGTSAATVVFNATVVGPSASQIRFVSGEGQSAIVNQTFGEALVAQVLDTNGQGVANVTVPFTVRSGGVILSSATATSDANGFVRINVTAGGNAGAATVSADFGGTAVTYNLTVRPVGPTLTADGVTNAASPQQGISPGSLATIRGTNIASGIRGYVLPQYDFGPRPTTLAGVTVSFGGVLAPIFWVSNVDGQEAVTVQVPFEVGGNSSVPVTVSSGGTTATVNVQVANVAPGIFETVDSQNRRFAVAIRRDGAFITPDNPASRGELVRVYATGLGRTNPPATTNSYGAGGQGVNGSVIVGVNDGGVEVISAEYAQGLVGVYVITFRIPSDTATGTSRNIAVAVDGVFSNGSNIAIR
ncbi:MAG TPA: Ig-like domain-containing protein [Bryobacteraceae bacterium]|nr:Ig-like domain-containing protein [Bryobacteraceae bacterium]